MNILIIGASGMAGQAIYREAGARGHKNGHRQRRDKSERGAGAQADVL